MNYGAINVREVIVKHPFFSQVQPQLVWVKHKLEECVHFVCFLRSNEFAEVLLLQLVEAEEAEVGKDCIHGHIVSI